MMVLNVDFKLIQKNLLVNDTCIYIISNIRKYCVQMIQFLKASCSDLFITAVSGWEQDIDFEDCWKPEFRENEWMCWVSIFFY